MNDDTDKHTFQKNLDWFSCQHYWNVRWETTDRKHWVFLIKCCVTMAMLCKGTFHCLWKNRNMSSLRSRPLEKILVFSLQGNPKQRENGIGKVSEEAQETIRKCKVVFRKFSDYYISLTTQKKWLNLGFGKAAWTILTSLLSDLRTCFLCCLMKASILNCLQES